MMMPDVKTRRGFRDKHDDNSSDLADDEYEAMYLLSRDSPFDSNHVSYPKTEEDLVEISQPHVTHKHNLFEVLNDELLQQMVDSVIKTNYFWTRIGIDQSEAQAKIELLQTKLSEVIQSFVADEKTEYRSYGNQIYQLKQRIESVLGDLETLMNEDELLKLMESCEEQLRPSGTKQLDSCLRVQKACLYKRYQTLLAHRNQHLQLFQKLKGELKSILHFLGLSGLADSRCASILTKHVVNHEEMTLLQNCTDAYRAQLEQRRAYCQEVSRKVCFIARLVPHQIDESYLLSNHDSQEHYLVFSEENQSKLEQLHEDVLQSALATWRQLNEAFERLGKLYCLFEVATDLRHPCFNTIAKMTSTGSIEQTAESGLPHLDLFEEQHITLVETLHELQAELDHYQALKNERIGELIVTVRRQFVDLLNTCLVSVDNLQRDERFQFLFTAENFDDNLLIKHEEEMDRLRQYHRKYESILSQVAKLRELKNELFNCEQEMQNGNNYRNRGGILNILLTKQRVTKKQLAQITQQIGAWLLKTKSPPTPTDDSLPFDLYNLRVEDIAREVGPAPPPPPPLASVRQTAAVRSSSTPFSSSHGYTPLFGKKNPQAAKMKLFQSAQLKSGHLASASKFAGHSSRFNRF